MKWLMRRWTPKFQIAFSAVFMVWDAMLAITADSKLAAIAGAVFYAGQTYFFVQGVRRLDVRRARRQYNQKRFPKEK